MFITVLNGEFHLIKNQLLIQLGIMIFQTFKGKKWFKVLGVQENG